MLLNIFYSHFTLYNIVEKHFLSYVVNRQLICCYSTSKQSTKCGKDVNGGNYLFKTEPFAVCSSIDNLNDGCNCR